MRNYFILVLTALISFALCNERTFNLKSGNKVTGDIVNIDDSGNYTVNTSMGEVVFNQNEIVMEYVKITTTDGDRIIGVLQNEDNDKFHVKTDIGLMSIAKIKVNLIDFNYDDIESDEDEIKELFDAVEKGFLSKWIPMLPKNPDRQVKGSEYHPNQSLFNLIRPCPDLPSPTITQQGQQKGLSGVIHYEHDRKLTIPELKRVQGLPEDFEVTGTFNQRAERIGRMVAPKCIAALATSVYNKVLSYD